MTENKRFSFGVDIPMSWKQKTLKNERRFSDLEGFLDEDYDGEHHMLWDNQEKCWIHLDDALCLMEKEYWEIRKENEQLKQENKKLKQSFGNIRNSISRLYRNGQITFDERGFYLRQLSEIEDGDM